MLKKRTRPAVLVLIVLAAAVAVLLPSGPAAAATSQRTMLSATLQYNAGDTDPAAGPNTFVLHDPVCNRFLVFVEYWWGTKHDRIFGCDRTVSIAPLGDVAHQLRWRPCWVDGRNLITRPPVCSSTDTFDVVYTGP
jgi:hypothetical protein